MCRTLLIVPREEVNSMDFYTCNLCLSICSDRCRCCTSHLPCIFLPGCGKEGRKEISALPSLSCSRGFCFVPQSQTKQTWSLEDTRLCRSAPPHLPPSLGVCHRWWDSRGPGWMSADPAHPHPPSCPAWRDRTRAFCTLAMMENSLWEGRPRDTAGAWGVLQQHSLCGDCTIQPGLGFPVSISHPTNPGDRKSVV